MLEMLGRMIWHIREEVERSQNDIARGLLSTAELCKIEYGEKEADYFLLEAIFQRLGKSIDKIEWIVTQEEYRLLYLRDEIVEALQKQKYETVEKLLEKYQWYTDEKPLHMQYRLMVLAVMEYSNQKEAECISLLVQAIKTTFSDWKEIEESNVYLCRQELQVLLMLAYILSKTEDKHMAMKILLWVKHYIEHRVADEEEKVDIGGILKTIVIILLAIVIIGAAVVFTVFWIKRSKQKEKELTDQGTIAMHNPKDSDLQ